MDALLDLLRVTVCVAERERVGEPEALGDPDVDKDVDEETQTLPDALGEGALLLLANDGLANPLALTEIVDEGEIDAEGQSEPTAEALGLTLLMLAVAVEDGKLDTDGQGEVEDVTDALLERLRVTVCVAERERVGEPEALGDPDVDKDVDEETQTLPDALGEGALLLLANDGLAKPLALTEIVDESEIDAEGLSVLIAEKVKEVLSVIAAETDSDEKNDPEELGEDDVLTVPDEEGEGDPEALFALVKEAVEHLVSVCVTEGEELWLRTEVPLALGLAEALPLSDARLEADAHPEPVPLTDAEPLPLLEMQAFAVELLEGEPDEDEQIDPECVLPVVRV